MADSASGRFANVAGAVIPGADSGARALRIAQGLAALFEEVIWAGAAPEEGAAGRRAQAIEGPPGALRDIASALAAARAERVLVVAAGAAEISPDLLLALVAWPEAVAVAPRAGASEPPACVLVCREAALAAIRAEWAAGRNDVRRWLDGLATDWLDPGALPDS